MEIDTDEVVKVCDEELDKCFDLIAEKIILKLSQRLKIPLEGGSDEG